MGKQLLQPCAANSEAKSELTAEVEARSQPDLIVRGLD